MAKIIRALLPLIILAACGWIGWWLITHKPELKAMETRPVLVSVEGITLKKTSYPVRVASQGAVQPRTRSTLLPEVAGMIVEVSPSFRPGGFFEKDEVLINLRAEWPPFFSRFQRLIEIVSLDEQDRGQARERFKFYRDRGYAIQSHDLSKSPQ